jgi:hypothetical protein
VQAGYHFSWSIGRIAADRIEPRLKDRDRFVDPAVRAVIPPALEMLGRRRSNALVGWDG